MAWLLTPLTDSRLGLRISFAKPKSRQLDMAALSYKDIRGLDVAMDDSLAVGRAQCSISVAHSITSSSGSALPPMRCLSVAPSQKLHRNKRLAVLPVDLIDGADVGMVQRGRRTCLSAKTFEGLRVIGHVIGKKFECDKTA